MRTLNADVYVTSKINNICYLFKDVDFSQKINHYTGSVSVITCGIPESYEEYPCIIKGKTLSQSKSQIIECQSKGYVLQCLNDISKYITNIDKTFRNDYYELATKSYHYATYYIDENKNEISAEVKNKLEEYLSEIKDMLPELSMRTSADEFTLRRKLWISLTEKQIQRLGSPCQY